MFQKKNEMTEEQKKAMKAKVQEIYEDGFLEIEGVQYKFLKMTHRDRLKVLAYTQKIEDKSSYMGDEQWQEIERHICNHVSVNNDVLSKLPDHFEADNNASHYFTFMSYAIQVVVFPFARGKATS